MSDILLVVAIFTAVFLADYLFYVKQKQNYNYVSWQTLTLFALGQSLVIGLFWQEIKGFFIHLPQETFFISVLVVVLVAFTRELVKDQLYVCHLTSRTERCLNPGYVIVKGAELVFQQLVYLVIALAIVDLLGFNLLSFMAYIQILLIIHTPVVISCNKPVVSRLTFGIGIIAAPILYIFTEIGYFFPAVYLHSLLYMFYWATFADADDKNDHIVENSG